jgi:hypothetical protein
VALVIRLWIMAGERFALEEEEVARCVNRQGLRVENGGRRREETTRFGFASYLHPSAGICGRHAKCNRPANRQPGKFL